MTRTEATALVGKKIHNVWGPHLCLTRKPVTVERIDDGGYVSLRPENGKLLTFHHKVIKSWEID